MTDLKTTEKSYFGHTGRLQLQSVCRRIKKERKICGINQYIFVSLRNCFKHNHVKYLSNAQNIVFAVMLRGRRIYGKHMKQVEPKDIIVQKSRVRDLDFWNFPASYVVNLYQGIHECFYARPVCSQMPLKVLSVFSNILVITRRQILLKPYRS